MKILRTINHKAACSTLAMLLIVPTFSVAQTPVDDDGNVIGTYESQNQRSTIDTNGAPVHASDELQELVGPVALYPDDLLAIVLPASAYPLQIAAAARFLAALENDPTLKPDPDWDDAVVALTNYPEVIELMNEDLDWTYRLGEAVIAQQADVVAAIEAFRDRAYLAGNLKSDEYQTVSQDEGVIEISPVADDVIYVPYYEPRRVVVYQPRPVYYYHPHAYPVYYYPYSANHHFSRGYFWGVTTAFSIGWFSDSLHVYHHSYYGHPYYGHHYRHHNYWYRRPSINVYNTTYVNNTRYASNREGYANRYARGDRWQARDNRRELVRREGYTRSGQRTELRTGSIRKQRDPIRFRERDNGPVTLARNERRQDSGPRPDTTRERQVQTRQTQRRDSRSTGDTIRFRDRSTDRSNERNTQSQEQRRNTTTTDRAGTTRRQPAEQQTRRRQEQPSRERAATTTRQQVQRSPQRTQPKRTESRRQEQPPKATQSRQRDSSGSSERSSRPKQKRESRSSDRDRRR